MAPILCKPLFATLLLFATSVLAKPPSDCNVKILNINNANVGGGCVPVGGSQIITTTLGGYLVQATDTCGLSVAPTQQLPDGWSVQYAGPCTA